MNCQRLNEHMNIRVGKLAAQKQSLDNFLNSANLSRELELLSCDLRSHIDLGASPAKVAEIFLREIGQTKLADDAIEHHRALSSLVEGKFRSKSSEVGSKLCLQLFIDLFRSIGNAESVGHSG